MNRFKHNDHKFGKAKSNDKIIKQIILNNKHEECKKCNHEKNNHKNDCDVIEDEEKKDI